MYDDNFIIAVMSVLSVIMLLIGYFVGENKGVDKFVNKICQQTQYEFCQPTYTYKAKGADNE